MHQARESQPSPEATAPAELQKVSKAFWVLQSRKRPLAGVMFFELRGLHAGPLVTRDNLAALRRHQQAHAGGYSQLAEVSFMKQNRVFLSTCTVAATVLLCGQVGLSQNTTSASSSDKKFVVSA